MTTTVRRLVCVLLELSLALATLASVGRSVGLTFYSFAVSL